MKNSAQGIIEPTFPQYVVCYLVWFCLAILTIWIVLQTQTNLIIPIRFTRMDYRMVTVLNDTSLIITGIVALIAIIILEHVLRTGLRNHLFWPRVARTITLEAVVLAVSYVVAYVLPKLLA